MSERSRLLNDLSVHGQQAVSRQILGSIDDGLSSQAIQLVVSVNTIPRPQGETYLLRCLDSFSEQLPQTGVIIYVLNLRPGEHSVFARAQQQHSGDTRFIFAEAEPEREDTVNSADMPADETATDGLSGNPLPGPRNRQQTRDVAMLLRHVITEFGGRNVFVDSSGPPVMLIEDDFVLCENAISRLLGILRPGVLVPADWTAIRVSYGLCGIVMQMADLSAFADYILAQQAYRPVDILAYYWFARDSSQRQAAAITHFGPKRTNVVYRHNLLNHIGAVSTYPGRAPRQFAGCHDVLEVWSLHKHERFDLEHCQNWMTSPCLSREPELDDPLRATPALIAGETIPHTAPWEQ